MAHTGKRFKAAAKTVNVDAAYGLQEAVHLVKSNAKAKFDETIEIYMNLGIDPRQNDQNVRGMVQLPNGTGKEIRVAVFAKGDKADEALAAGRRVRGRVRIWPSGSRRAR